MCSSSNLLFYHCRVLGFLWVYTLMAHTMSHLDSFTPSQLLAKTVNGLLCKVSRVNEIYTSFQSTLICLALFGW